MPSKLGFAAGGGPDFIGFSGASGFGDPGSETEAAELLIPPSVLLEKTQLSCPLGDRCQLSSSLAPSEKGPTESISIPELFLNSMTSPALSSHCCCKSLPTTK